MNVGRGGAPAAMRALCPRAEERHMPPGDKSAYTNKQQHQAEHLEQGYQEQGVSEPEAERRAWATVNAMTHGGKKSGSGRGQPENLAPAQKGGRLGGHSGSRDARSRAAKKGWETRRRHER
jgi:hypothetical protein